jgi:hypothetical protein
VLLSDFWAQQRFSYLVTYSFQRGPELTALKQQLRQELETARYMRRAALYQQLEALEQHSLTLTQGLSTVHPTATAVAQLAAGSAEVQQLTLALQRPSEQECYAMCPPIYRDAVAFYDKADELVRVLNICFECRFMQTDQQEHVEADMATYDFLRTFLIQAGHPIEADGWA